MISKWVRKRTKKFLKPMVKLIGKTGMPPNFLTTVGCFLHLGVTYAIAVGRTKVGGLLLAVAGLFDALDGALARSEGRSSRFGAFLDSTLDRFSEAMVYLGFLIFYINQDTQLESFLVYAAIVGSLMVSYTRARAEGLGIECKVGLLTRFERIVVLILGLLTQRLLIALWVLAIFTHFTALQRIYHVWRVTKKNA